MEQIFIYLIIFVVMILFSAMQNKKKQQAAREALLKKQQQKQQSLTDSIEDIFKKLGDSGYIQPESELSSEGYIPEVNEQAQYASYENTFPEIQKIEKKPLRKRIREEVLFEEKEDLDHLHKNVDFQINNLDEMKKAIVYSEIINRKYV